MPDLDPSPGKPAVLASLSGWSRRRKFALGVAAIVLLLLAYGWIQRERIADRIIGGQLEGMAIPGSYAIEDIGLGRQVIRDVVIGDPDNPDLTVERLEITVVPAFGMPRISRAKLVRPRLYGRYRDGKLSFGRLDELIFPEESTAPAGLPGLDLTIIDGRALIDSEFGPVGAKAEGRGNLRDGFAGILALNAPQLASGSCRAQGATLYGKVTTDGGKAAFAGPMRLASLTCPDNAIRLQKASLRLEVASNEMLDRFDGQFGLASQRIGYGESSSSEASGSGSFVWAGEGLRARYNLALLAPRTTGIAMKSLASDGTFRSSSDFSRFEWRADWEGESLRLSRDLGRSIDALVRSAGETPLGPLASKLRRQLDRESRGSKLAADTIVRRRGGSLSFVMPQAAVRGASGENLLAVSRFQMSFGESGVNTISGNLSTGGPGLPQVTARMEQEESGGARLHLAMPDYRAGKASLAIPELRLVRRPGGAVGLAGAIHLDGPLPGGRIERLVVPLTGNWADGAGLRLWPDCTSLRFAGLALAGFEFPGNSVTVCPDGGGAIVRGDGRGLRVAARSKGVALEGAVGGSPARLTTGPLRLRFPGEIEAKDAALRIGAPDDASLFRFARLSARLDGQPHGTFGGGEVRLAAVPLDILDAGGDWRYAGGSLLVSEGILRVEDREPADRFEPLVARGGSLAFDGDLVTARAVLREPESDREITHVDLRHSLASGEGRADLSVPGVRFDEGLQPDTLTALALGVVANANGTVRGEGRIVWDAQEVRSSGRFHTQDFDFAAAFGPVHGVSGTIEFTDLLNFVTAPGQRLTVRSFNPGVEVEDGEIVYRLAENFRLAVASARWPFMGGTLALRPTEIPLASDQVRKFVLEIEGLDAARFVERMELANMSATGTFDGNMPLVFDENGGHLVGGLLVSRPPGGNVSYVGELTYKDLSAMANFAFDALRSLDYTEMTVAMDGELTGELVTRVGFRGVSQGAGAKRNILTRQVAKLPVRFNVNVRAPFYKLITSVKSMYDPAYIRDPRELGLLGPAGDGSTMAPQANEPGAATPPPSKPAVQASDSETVP